MKENEPQTAVQALCRWLRCAFLSKLYSTVHSNVNFVPLAPIDIYSVQEQQPQNA